MLSYDPATNVASYYTNDASKEGSYPCRLIVEYDDPCLTQIATLDFTFIIAATEDPACLAATFSIAISLSLVPGSETTSIN